MAAWWASVERFTDRVTASLMAPPPRLAHFYRAVVRPWRCRQAARLLIMFAALFDFFLGWAITSSAINTGRTARASALAAERASWTESMKAEFQIEQSERALRRHGRRRFVFALYSFTVVAALAWRVGALILGALFGH